MSGKRSGRYAVRSGKRTDIPDLRNRRYEFHHAWTLITTRHGQKTAWRCVEIVESYRILKSFFKFSNEQHLAYQRLQKIYLPTYKTDLEDLL